MRGFDLEQTIHVPKNKKAIAYTASLLDGEGTIHPHHYVANIANTDFKAIMWLKKTWKGGHVERRPYKSGKGRIYIWWINRAVDVRTFLRTLLPYLVIKRKRAIKMLERIEDGMKKMREELDRLPYPDLFYGFEEEFAS